MRNTVFICDAIRTAIGRYGGALSPVRTDDLAAVPLKALMERNPGVDWSNVDDVILGCANQAGEDNRNVARMALLLAGISETVPGVTVNRLCGSGMEAVGLAARAIRAGEGQLVIAGGVESMSRAPFVMAKALEPFQRTAEVYDTTLGWRFINKEMDRMYGTESMIQTAENLAVEFGIGREEQDVFAFYSQRKAAEAISGGLLAGEICPVSIPSKKGETLVVNQDEHPRLTPVEKLASLKPVTGKEGSVTAGNSSGLNDGAAALLIASEEAVKKYNLIPKARVLGMQAAGVPPRTMGIGPVPATQKLLQRLGLSLGEMNIIEINEAFAAQALACLRGLGLANDDDRINRLGGAIALGHPLGMSGARLVTTAMYQLQQTGSRYALCTMCIGVGQGVAVVLERV